MIHGLILLVILACPSLSLGQAINVFGDCDVFLGTDSSGADYLACIERAVSEGNARELTIQQLEELLEDHPENPWPAQYLARLEWNYDNDAAAAYYSVAAQRFELLGEFAKAVDAHLNVTRLLNNQGRIEEAFDILGRAEAVAGVAASVELDALVQLQRAHLLARSGRDIGLAYRILVDIEATVTPISEYDATSWLDTMGYVTYELGLYRRAMVYRRRMIDVLLASDQSWWEAQARYDYAIAYRSEYESAPSVRGEYLELMKGVLRAAVAGENARVEWGALLELGKLLRGDEGVRYLRSCIDVAETMGDDHGVSSCKRALAGVTADEDPQAADELLSESIDLANEAGDLQAEIYGAAERVSIRWLALPRGVAISDALAVLDLIETYRLLQTTEGGRVGVFSVWSEMYSRIAGLLLGTPEMPPSSADLELAFLIMERGRARALIEARQPPRATSSASTPAGTEHAAVLRQIIEVQRALLDPELPATRRANLTAELHRVETHEVTLRSGMTQSLPASTGDFTSLKDVQARLAPNEALLAFQVAQWENMYGNFAGGSWVLSVTRENVRARRLPGRTELDSVVPAFVGLTSQRSDLYRKRAVLIHQMLLTDSLGDLPDNIDRLIIVPDGVLHRLPFAALVQDATGEPLVHRYELSIVPSATLWAGWRDTAGAATPAVALVFADPTLGVEAHAGFVAQVGGGVDAGSRLGPLPYARREGRAVKQHLRGVTRVLEGEAATEAALQGADLESYGILHLAAHAVIDEDFPDRSAVYLATASDDSDGLLQRREIVDLPLESKIVVLSGCQSATGAVLRGEGVMSLARSFFQAGATTVVGSLWPLRDDDAAAIFESFYEHLAAGMSVSGAMQHAQIDLQGAGLPAAAWAGVVVLGDGAVVPFPGGVPAKRYANVMLIAMVAVLLTLFLAGGRYLLRR